MSQFTDDEVKALKTLAKRENNRWRDAGIAIAVMLPLPCCALTWLAWDLYGKVSSALSF